MSAATFAPRRTPRGIWRPHDKTIEDVEFLLSWGVCWSEICRRLDRTPEALERYLYRHRRGDLVTKGKVSI